MGYFESSIGDMWGIIERNTKPGAKTASGLTGPLEGMRKWADSWGITDNPDRVTLRSDAAQLRDILYQIRGKQLSDFEIKMTEDIFASMGEAQSAFVPKLESFANYVYNAIMFELDYFDRSDTDIGGLQDKLDEWRDIRDHYGPGVKHDGKGFYITQPDGAKGYIVEE